MKPRTLVGRVAAVQVLTLVSTLVAVIGAAYLATQEVLIREWDLGLRNVAARVAEEISEEPEGTGDDWLDEVVGDHRPVEVRIELQTAGGKFVGEEGQGPRLKAKGSGCRNQKDFRVCQLTAGNYFVLASRSREREDDILRRFVTVTTLVALAVTLLAAFLSRTVVAGALTPLSRMAARIRDIRPGAGERLADTSKFTELRVLSTSFDGMLERVDEALARERRFAAEASHELRTPLTVLRGEIETMARNDGEGSPAGRALRSVDDLVGLVEALLWLSRAHAPLEQDQLELVNLSEVVREQIGQLEPRYPSRAVQAQLPDELLVRAEQRLLARAVANLIDNALKYSRPPAPIEIALRTCESMGILAITDRGPGVAEGLRDRIFEPFFRGGMERAQTPGFGLGLPLARAVARVHGGDIVVTRTSEAGSCFELHVPLATEPAARGEGA